MIPPGEEGGVVAWLTGAVVAVLSAIPIWQRLMKSRTEGGRAVGELNWLERQAAENKELRGEVVLLRGLLDTERAINHQLKASEQASARRINSLVHRCRRLETVLVELHPEYAVFLKAEDEPDEATRPDL